MSDPTIRCACGAEIRADEAACSACGEPRPEAAPGSLDELVRRSGAPLVGLGAAAVGTPAGTGVGAARRVTPAKKAEPRTMRIDLPRVDAFPTIVPGALEGGAATTVPLSAHIAADPEIAEAIDGSHPADPPGTGVDDSPGPRSRDDAPTAMLPAIRRKRSARGARAVPLLALLVALAAALVFGVIAATHRSGAETPPVAPTRSAVAPPTVLLPAVEATLGLTEDNKEIVLALCYRLSDNYAHECRRQYLSELGEFPHREVAFGALEADRFEVSNATWLACEQAGACRPRDIAGCGHHTVARGLELRTEVPASVLADDHPAVCVTWQDAVDLCAWRGMRLPSGDEWERIGRSGDDRLQPWGPFLMPGLMNWGERVLGHYPIPGRVDGYELTAPVDEFRSGATDEGVHNMLGNVAEWVADAPDRAPDGPAEVRGGSYVDDAFSLRLTHRDTAPRDARRTTIGFRCVR